jgi:hypothetical protein
MLFSESFCYLLGLILSSYLLAVILCVCTALLSYDCSGNLITLQACYPLRFNYPLTSNFILTVMVTSECLCNPIIPTHLARVACMLLFWICTPGPTYRDKVQVQVQVRATLGLGFLVLLL